MPKREPEPDEAGPGRAGLRPGQLSAILQDLVRASPDERGEAWAQALGRGAVIGRFELIREIGRGGFGVVWEAKDRELGRAVAFKAIHAVGPREVAEEWLLREAESAARLSHPNIVTLFDVGRSTHGPYLVLELLRGRTLAERLDLGRVSVREALHVTSEIAKGVAHAHAKGVVHRDLKPANVFLCDDGQVKVLDFGMAHAFGQRRQDGGTPAYMAPEQWEGAPEDERTDVFAMGVLLYRLLAGELPFPDDAGKSVQGSGPAPMLEVPELPGLGDLVTRMLEKRPVLRPRDGGEVLSALRTLQLELERSPASGAMPVTTRPRAGLAGLVSELRRRRVVPAMVGYGTFALVALRAVDWLAQSGRVPGWASALSLALLGLGLPAALFFAWRYDLTGQGIRRTPAATNGSAGPGGSRRARVALVLAFVGVAAAVPGLVYWFAFSSAAAGRPSRSDGRVLVAIADVVNETGEKDLDVLSGLLVTSLEQSRKLSVMTQARVLDLAVRAGRKDALRVDETIGREVGRASGVRALLLPAIRRLGATYSLEMRAIDPVQDRHLFTASDRATSRDALLELLDRLCERTRRELGEHAAEVAEASVQLGDAVTRSMEAYQHYVTGLDVWLRDGQRSAGLKEFLEAVRLDPRFAAAHNELWILYSAYGRPDLAAAHARAAVEHVARMPEKERLLLRLFRAAGHTIRLDREQQRDVPEALRLAAALESRFPDDKTVLARVAAAYVTPDIDRKVDAERVARRALLLDPGYAYALRILDPLLVGRTAERLENARRAVAARRNAGTLALLAEAEIAAGSRDAAAEAAREALQRDGSKNSLNMTNACAVLDFTVGKPSCVTEWRRLLSAGSNEHERDFARFQLVTSLAIEGRRSEAQRLARSVPENRRGDPLLLARALSIGLPRTEAVESRDVSRAIADVAIRRYMIAWFGGPEEPLQTGQRSELDEQFFAPLRLARQGRHAEAAEIQARNRDWAHEHDAIEILTFHTYLLAEELLAARRFEEVVALGPHAPPDRLVWLSDQAENGPRLALVRARALEQLGRNSDAVRELDGVISFWKDADPDLPLLVEAKRTRLRLVNGPRAVRGVAPDRTPARTRQPR